MQWGDSDAEKEVARLQKVKLSLEADLVNEKGKVIQLEETKKEQSLTIKDHLQYVTLIPLLFLASRLADLLAYSTVGNREGQSSSR